MGIILVATAILVLPRAKNPRISYDIIRSDTSWMSAFCSESEQTDHDPWETNSGMTCSWGTVAANHLPLYTRLKIEGFGDKIFIVADRHSPRYGKLIDIWFPSKKDAKKFGRKKLRYWLVKNVKINGKPINKDPFLEYKLYDSQTYKQ